MPGSSCIESLECTFLFLAIACLPGLIAYLHDARYFSKAKNEATQTAEKDTGASKLMVSSVVKGQCQIVAYFAEPPE